MKPHFTDKLPGTEIIINSGVNNGFSHTVVSYKKAGYTLLTKIYPASEFSSSITYDKPFHYPYM